MFGLIINNPFFLVQIYLRPTRFHVQLSAFYFLGHNCSEYKPNRKVRRIMLVCTTFIKRKKNCCFCNRIVQEPKKKKPILLVVPTLDNLILCNVHLIKAQMA